MSPRDRDDEDDADWDDADWEDIDEECRLMPDGQCLLAGTEFCDWDCGRLGLWEIEDD